MPTKPDSRAPGDATESPQVTHVSAPAVVEEPGQWVDPTDLADRQTHDGWLREHALERPPHY